jgi:hypothetical protein
MFRTRIMNQLPAVALNEGLRCKKNRRVFDCRILDRQVLMARL